MGAELQFHEHEITIKCAELKGIDWDLTDSPDLFPIVAVLCSVARGKSKLEGLRRLRFKESDRITSMMEGLSRMGVKTETSDEAVTINGGSPQGAAINPYDDHRIAMSFGVLGLVAGGETTIKNAECVSKSYPDFWDDLKVIGARIGR
jgi:3-phosphoshikimate 1-carboxyvinyltransferase